MPQPPKLSHAQFAVLSSLMGGPASGREIRKRLAEFGMGQGGPAFYQLMARMEDGSATMFLTDMDRPGIVQTYTVLSAES